MELPEEETCKVAFNVFDRYGTVKAKYKDHPVQRGTGVWGIELDHGPLFLIEEIRVTALDLRRKGLGRQIVSLLLKKANQYSLDDKPDCETADIYNGSNEIFERAWTLHALTGPGYLTTDIQSHLVGRSAEERLMTQAQHQIAAMEFWRSCGFRRIGASLYFAFSFDPQHPSHALEADSDFDPRSSHAEDLENEELRLIYEADHFTEVEELKMEKLRDALPLHHAALTLTDEELQDFFFTHVDDPIGWNRVTNLEATLLHLTACALKPMSTQWLLENIHYSDSWKAARDIDGYTPLEALQEKLEKMRTQGEYGLYRILDVSDQFTGNPETAVRCLSLLLGEDASNLNEACIKYGCTCGECVGGFLSARMMSALIFQGELTYDFMQRDIDDGRCWVKFNDWKLEHLDPDVRHNLETNKSIRKGLVNMFQIAAECLEAKQVPTAQNLECWSNDRREWPPNTKNFLRRAGAQMGCRAVLRRMFDAAKDEDEKAGNRLLKCISGNELSHLPRCRNDHEFEFVARACGYGGTDSISQPHCIIE